MENFVLRSRGVHSLRHEIGPVILKKQSRRHQSPRGLVLFNQPRNRCCFKTISSSLHLRSVTSRLRCSSKHWISHTRKDDIFSAKPVLRVQRRVIRMGLGSDTGKDSEASKTRSSAWSFSDNLRYLICFFTAVLCVILLCVL